MSDTLQYLTNDRGERTAVVLSIADYEKLMEDIEDLSVVAERRGEATVPHEEFVAEMKRDGIV
jgi:PHD/YefM family antitoxin component YafN of YafNO toxin-antitoxin module